MERYRLKNIIILILALMNLFLLASLTARETSRQSARRTAAEQLVSLFAADGITLDPSMISDEIPPSERTLTQDTALERRVAAMLLGNNLTRSDQGGNISTYSSDRGAALFRPGGFNADGTLEKNDPEGFCREFCKKFGYEAPVFQSDSDGDLTATVTRLYDGYSVFNCTVTFTISGGSLTSVSGTLLPDAYTETASDVQPLSASAALTVFQKMWRETGAVASSITDLYCCYELQSSVPMSLVPAWCVETNTDLYYVNCYTGAVTSV